MNAIFIRYPDGNINKFEMQNDEVLSLRKIFLNHAQNLPPLEVTLLIDENTNTFVTRDEPLKTDVPYKLVDCREMIKCFNSLRDSINQKDKQILEQQQIINENQQQLDSQKKQIGDQVKQNLDDLQNKNKDLQYNFQLEKEKNNNLQKELDNIKENYNNKKNKYQKSKEMKTQVNQIESQCKQQIDDLKKQIIEFQEQKNQGQNQLKQLIENNNNLKNKYKEFKEKIKQISEEKTKVESQFACFELVIKNKQEKIQEKENEIKQKEEQHQKNIELQKVYFDQHKITFENQIQRECERLKVVEQRFQDIYQENQSLKIAQNSNEFINKSQSFSQKDLEMEILQQKLNFEKKINDKEYQIDSLQKQNNIKDIKIKELTQNLEQINKESNIQKSKLKDYEEKVLELEKIIVEKNCQTKNLNSIIEMVDSEFIKKNGQIEAFQEDLYNNYKYRLTRLVELIPRFYKEEINFAVEEMFSKKLYEKKGKLIDQTYQVYQLSHKKTKDIIFNQSNLDIKQTIIKSYKQNIHGQLSQEKIVSDQKYPDKSRLVDSIQLYYSKSIDNLNDELSKINTEKSDKIYMIKETFTNQQNNIGDIDFTLNLLSRSIVAQIILEEFVAELKKKNIQIPFKFQFVQPVLFSIKINFKQYFLELSAKQGQKQYTNAFQTVLSLLNIMEDQFSNDFYEYIRELQHTRLEIKSQDGKTTYESNKEAQAQFIQTFIHLSFQDNKRDPFKNIIQQFNQCSNEEKLNAFIYLTDLLSETYDKFPLEKFYYGYELTLKDIDNKSVFQKYNGGALNFDSSEQGKFLSALSFYSIKRTEQQFCVSHIQGIGNYLYDPLVSSYDGFLDCLDQGINEIRNIESAFQSSNPGRIGSKYIEALGINME